MAARKVVARNGMIIFMGLLLVGFDADYRELTTDLSANRIWLVTGRSRLIVNRLNDGKWLDADEGWT